MCVCVRARAYTPVSVVACAASIDTLAHTCYHMVIWLVQARAFSISRCRYTCAIRRRQQTTIYLNCRLSKKEKITK